MFNCLFKNKLNKCKICKKRCCDKEEKITYDDEYYYIINHKESEILVYFDIELLYSFKIQKIYKSKKSFLCILEPGKYLYISKNKRSIFKTSDKIQKLENYIIYTNKYIIFPEKQVYLKQGFFISCLKHEEVEKDIQDLYEFVNCYGGYLYGDDL